MRRIGLAVLFALGLVLAPLAVEAQQQAEKTPVMYTFREFVDSGGLFSYGRALKKCGGLLEATS